MPSLAQEMDTEIKLEVVYYSSPIPRSMEVITLLGLVFDRVHFPHTYLPTEGFTNDEIEERIRRLEPVLKSDIEQQSYLAESTLQMIRALRLLRWNEWTKEFLYFTGDGSVWKEADKVGELAEQIFDLTFGPPPVGWEPTITTGSSFAVSPELGRGDASIAFAGEFHYPALAIKYAGENSLPLLNDVPRLAVPGTLVAPKEDAKMLASIIATECIKFLLPTVPSLDIWDLLDFRDEMKPYVSSFRLSILRLARTLNSMIGDGATSEEIGKKAAFLVETDVQPPLIELKNYAESPERRWYKNVSDLVPLASKIVGSFSAVPSGLPVSASLVGVGGLFAGDVKAEWDREAAVKRSPIYYLLEVERLKRR